MNDLVLRFVYSALTMYMLLILLRWFGPWLELNLHRPWVSWIPKVTDPLIQRVRRVLPPMGPVDFGPVAVLFLVFIVRQVALSILSARGG